MTLLQLRDSDKEEISIHTSAREVTSVRTQNTVELSISIHTSAREVTEDDGTHGSDHNNFNPHFRKGSDVWCGIPSAGSGISIHTSAREVTGRISPTRSATSISIHTSAREVTAGQEVSHKALGISIHTSAREVTTHPVCWMWTGLDFNPHFRKGSDGKLEVMLINAATFQSTLPQGK